jgi:prepilin-type N-terminal cleavage/methylation domain-containing protein
MTRLRIQRRQNGFTVIEILVAVTIFSVVSLVIFALFRTAVRAQQTADRETRLIQQARFAMDTIGKDIANVFFRDETAYNVALTRLIEEMEAARLQAESTNNWDNFYALYGDPSKEKKDQNPTIGDPYEKGRIIDLQMEGKKNTLSFAVRSPFQIGGYYRPWGLARVEYRVSDGLLVRVARSVEAERRNIMGESVAERRIPEIARVAEGVQELELAYVFWFDNQWYETDTWNSANRQIRNPRYLIGNYEDKRLSTAAEGREGQAGGSFGPGVPGFNDSLNDSRSEPLDRLPALIRVRLRMADKSTPTRVHAFEALFRVPTATETWVPLEELEKEIREEEEELRAQRFKVVYPGTTRPPY